MCFIKHIKEIKTKHNDDMAFLEVMDQSGNEELIMFSDTYLKYKDYLDFNHLYLINVRVSKRNDKMSFIINKVEKVGK
jgi:DNA polymerase-3 subunit alpha